MSSLFALYVCDYEQYDVKDKDINMIKYATSYLLRLTIWQTEIINIIAVYALLTLIAAVSASCYSSLSQALTEDHARLTEQCALVTNPHS